MDVACAIGQAGELVEIWTEDPDGEIRRRAAESFVDPHPERGGEQRRYPRHTLDFFAHRLFELFERAAPVLLQHHEHVGQRVGHRILGALRAPGTPHHVFDLGELPQDVLHSMIEPVDLLERRFRREVRLQQERALVERGHEVAPDHEPECERGHEQCERPDANARGVAHAGIEHRRVDLLGAAHQPDVLRPVQRARAEQQRR
jgi:hypothetical protein